MKIRPLPSSLSNLPVFRYTRVTKDASVPSSSSSSSSCQRNTTHKAVTRVKGKEEYTRHTWQNMIDLAKWEGVARPPGYPSGLRFPEDVLKAVLYSRKRQRNGSRAKKKTPKRSACDGASSPATDGVSHPPEPQPIAREWARCASCKGVAKTTAQLCACTLPPWAGVATAAWRDAHIALRWVSGAVGVGAYALQPLRRGCVLGEYVGELVSGCSVDVDTSYLLSVADDAGAEEVCIDSLRVGEWTRFVNHSCRASTYFENRRVGDEARVVLVTEREVRSGEEVTVDYGKAYWETMNRKGVWCVCGEEGCRFSERIGRRRVERTERTERRRETR